MSLKRRIKRTIRKNIISKAEKEYYAAPDEEKQFYTNLAKDFLDTLDYIDVPKGTTNYDEIANGRTVVGVDDSGKEFNRVYFERDKAV